MESEEANDSDPKERDETNSQFQLSLMEEFDSIHESWFLIPLVKMPGRHCNLAIFAGRLCPFYVSPEYECMKNLCGQKMLLRASGTPHQ